MPSPKELYPLLAENAAKNPEDARLLKTLSTVDEILGEGLHTGEETDPPKL